MSAPLVTSIDVVRCAIEERVRELGGDDETVGEIALAACYAMWCTASSASPQR